ncbi:hypothetical protein KRP22_006878 [Phytophthora ramorum]|nr:Helicase domino [Phytophthora ramorum]
MEWMAADFSQERKWRVRNAKALSQALVSHLDRQEARLARQKKSELLAKRRAAARVGRDVKKFWSKIDKIIAFKVKLQADELRQRHMHKHLTQLVQQTEKYATALAASFQAGEETIEGVVLQEEVTNEVCRTRAVKMEISRRQAAAEVAALQEENELSVEELRARYTVVDEGVESGASSDADFEVTEEEEDDETTIEAEERRSGPVSRRQAAEEVAALQEENELSVEELRARYARALEDGDGEEDNVDMEEEDNGDDDFVPTRRDEEEQADDETTIEEEERQEGAVSPSKTAEELRLLQQEGELSIEELRARYTAPSDEEVSNHDDEPTESNEEHDPVETNLREYQEAGVNWLVSMCERRINGILADEMGLGKTIQTITLLAHLACAQGLWGPHLIVVPTSCLVNWEMEFKRWCPAFKVLTYFGSAKRRKELRQGWSKQNAFQVCITSYQLVVQDAHCFKRKKWYYLILDEAHNIKNWKSLRWQTLLTFSSQRRLLLTGTPLQNNLLELWALMHFLMPHVFASQALQAMVRDPEERLASLQPLVNKSVATCRKFARCPPVFSTEPIAHRILAPYYDSFKRTQLFFPDKALVQFDCGKLQQLAVLLRTLKRGGHRCLIFTQMSSMLNILEVFLNLHGHTYFRLDGATKVDKRQMLMDRFNRDEKIFCFILSTRSGGLGINLTGADATRDVHIYRLVSEHTVEENILRKAQQKRHLDFLVMSEGQFTTDFFSKASLRELMLGSTGEEPEQIESESEEEEEGTDEDG